MPVPSSFPLNPRKVGSTRGQKPPGLPWVITEYLLTWIVGLGHIFFDY
jgi:hypothetical protein